MFKVMKEPCNQCLFSKDRIVSAARVREVLKDCARQDTHFVCHKASIKGAEVCCRTFYDTRTTNLIRIAQRLRAVVFTDASGRATSSKPNGEDGNG